MWLPLPSQRGESQLAHTSGACDAKRIGISGPAKIMLRWCPNNLLVWSLELLAAAGAAAGAWLVAAAGTCSAGGAAAGAAAGAWLVAAAGTCPVGAKWRAIGNRFIAASSSKETSGGGGHESGKSTKIAAGKAGGGAFLLAAAGSGHSAFAVSDAARAVCRAGGGASQAEAWQAGVPGRLACAAGFAVVALAGTGRGSGASAWGGALLG